MSKQVLISDEAYEYVLKLKYESKNKSKIGEIVSQAILSNVKEGGVC